MLDAHLFHARQVEGEGREIALRGGPEDNSIGLDRTNGMLSEVEQSNIEVIKAPNFGGWSEDGGFTLMSGMLAQYDKIDVVFCENDSMCLGAQKAIQDAGRSEEMFLVGVDGQKEALLQILNGTNYAATGLNNSDQIERATSQPLDPMDHDPLVQNIRGRSSAEMPVSRAMQWWVSRSGPGRLPSPRKTRAASNRTGPG